MPFKSQAQRRFFHHLKEVGKLPSSIDLDEWDQASKGRKLPEHLAHGGLAGEAHENEYHMRLHGYQEADSTGEPDDVEYLAYGGYAGGGEVEEEEDEKPIYPDEIHRALAHAIMRRKHHAR